MNESAFEVDGIRYPHPSDLGGVYLQPMFTTHEDETTGCFGCEHGERCYSRGSRVGPTFLPYATAPWSPEYAAGLRDRQAMC